MYLTSKLLYISLQCNIKVRFSTIFCLTALRMVGVCCCVGVSVSVSVRLCVSPCLNPRLQWFLELNHLIQNFSFKDEITPWRIFTKGKKGKKSTKILLLLFICLITHTERGFSVWKIIIFVGFICGTWELGNELNLTDAVSASANYPRLLSYDHMCALLKVCVCVLKATHHSC